MRSITRITCSSFWNGHVRLLQPAVALDVDLLGAVDHDFVDGVVLQQRLDRPEAQDFRGDASNSRARSTRVRTMFSDFEYVVEDLFDLAAHLVGLA